MHGSVEDGQGTAEDRKNNRSEVINIMHQYTDMDNWPDENGTQLQNMNVSDLLWFVELLSKENDYLKEKVHHCVTTLRNINFIMRL
ncbi:Hypothetical predicted protein, partial [Mytilus galloprovincialis]